MSGNLTGGRTKVYSILMKDLEIPSDDDLESKISYILSIEKLDDSFGVSDSNIAALLQTKPKYVRKVCEDSDKFIKVGDGKGFSMWRLLKKVEEDNRKEESSL